MHRWGYLFWAIWASLQIVSSIRADEESAHGYSFKLDGRDKQPWVHSLNGTPDTPQAGDVVDIDRFPIVLGPPGKYEFYTTGDYNDGRLFLLAQDGKRTLVGVKVTWGFDQERFIRNPFDKLSPDEIHGLRGVYLDSWPEGLEATLEQLDFEHVCIKVTTECSQGEDKRQPPLPTQLRYLFVDGQGQGGFKSYVSLSSLKDLRWLHIDSRAPVDVTLFKEAQQLRYLCAPNDLENLSELANLKQLRELDFNYSNVDTVDFAKGLTELRRLNISMTGVKDLSPLADLEKLEWINANFSRVSKLPEVGLTGLHHLRAMKTSLTEEAVTEFEKSHPECRVAFGWNKPIKTRLASTTRIVIRSKHRNGTTAEVQNAAEIAKVIKAIRVDETKGVALCACSGDADLVFYHGDQCLATLVFHHGQYLAWWEEWPAMGTMTPQCANMLTHWLTKHGVSLQNTPEPEVPATKNISPQPRRRGWRRN